MMTPIFTLLYNIITLYLFLSVQCSPLNFSEIDEDVDTILKSALGNIPAVRLDLPPPPPTFLSEKYDGLIERRALSDTSMATPQVFTAKSPTPNRIKNLTAIIKERVKAREYDYLLRRNTNYLINLQNNVDEIEEISKPVLSRRQVHPSITYDWWKFYDYIDRFKHPREKVRHAFVFKNPGNYDYPINIHGRMWTLEKNRTLSIMHNWVYRTRFNLLYSQRIRGKYIISVRYKLGYCFAMLRQLKREQLMLFDGFLYHWKYQSNLYYHLKIYEKIARLDVDIKDLIKFIKILENARVNIEQPDFYTDFPSSTGTKWG